MKQQLHKDQLAQIVKFLERKHLTATEVFHEVKDHIATAIETEMATGNSFEQAFAVQKEIWTPELQSASSFWIGLSLVMPKIMLKEAVNIYQRMCIKVLPVAILLGVLIYLTLPYTKAYKAITNIVLLTPVLFAFGYLLYHSLIRKNTLPQTTFDILWKRDKWQLIFAIPIYVFLSFRLQYHLDNLGIMYYSILLAMLLVWIEAHYRNQQHKEHAVK
ncbi:MAG: hypothetical protein OIF50_11430 [Flavobacteriaceae bacterium]|nr:hypothetical protein [Flavobacteriaceae bacterium]